MQPEHDYQDAHTRSERVDLRRWQRDIESRVSVLEDWREDMRVRHANKPQWLFGAISVIISAAMLAVNLYASGVRP